MKKLLLLILICVFATSCTSMSQRLSAPPSTGKYQELGEADCTACSVILFGIIPIKHSSMPARAYNCAIQSKGGDDLINPVVQESWYYIVVGGLRCTNIKGTVIKNRP